MNLRLPVTWQTLTASVAKLDCTEEKVSSLLKISFTKSVYRQSRRLQVLIMSLFMSYLRDRNDPCNFISSLSRGAHFQHCGGKPHEVISFCFRSRHRSVSLVRVKANPTIISENDNIVPLLAHPLEKLAFLYMLCSHSVLSASLLPCGL